LLGRQHKLLSYSLKAITGGTDAQGEVMVQLAAGQTAVTGRGSHTDIIIASAKAYVNALNRLATRDANRHSGKKKRAPLSRS